MVMVTKAEAERLLEEEKVIGVNLSWKIEGSIQRLTAKVLCVESKEILSLRGYLGTRNRSFVLLHQNIPIRKYTVHAVHRDPITRKVFREPHKHTWDDEWKDRLVYIPDDIRIGDPNEELIDFLRECNISLRGTYAQLLFQ